MLRLERWKAFWALVLSAGFVLGGISVASAAERAGKFEMGVFAGGYVFEHDLELSNAPVGGGRLGYFLTDRVEPELSVEAVRTRNFDTHDPASLQEGHLDLLYHILKWGNWEPYAAVGAGMTRYQNSESDWDWAINYGLGARYWFTEDFSLRLDLRQPVSFGAREHNFMWTVGFGLLFGGAPAAAAAPAPAPAPVAAPAPAPAAPAAPKATLTAIPAWIQQGESSTLTWNTQNATDVSIEGIGSVSASGSQAVSPKEATNYRLTAKGPGGTADAMASVNVVEPTPPPPPPAPAPAKPLDSDRDGVTDDLDKCPGTPVGVAVDANGCPLDSDKDGVADYLDKCPGTPEGVKVDADGCPIDSDKDGVADYLDKCPGTPEGVKVDSTGCPLDSDKDGVADYLDKCPGTPEGVKVDSTGCPLDSDGDGVADYLDKCPNTPKGKMVDAKGCPEERKVIELMVLFDFDKYDVKPKYLDQIEKVAAFLKQYPKLTAMIEGHTDSVGTEEYNLKLSTRRANSVAKILTDKFGINMDRITAQSLGETKPVATNATAEGRQKNRRVYAILESE